MALEIADDLTRRTGANVVLVARSSFPAPADWPGWVAAHFADDPVSRKIARLQLMRASGVDVVVTRGDVPLPEVELRALAGRDLSHYKRPSRYVQVTSGDVPLSGTAKPQRAALAALAAARQASSTPEGPG